MNVIAFTLLQDGIPIIYYGQEQHLNGSGVPSNRATLWSTGGYDTSSPLYAMISQVNAIRKQAIATNGDWVTSNISTPYNDGHTIVTRKGDAGSQIVGVYSNLGENGGYYDLPLSTSDTGFESNEQVMEVLTCTLLTTDSDGSLPVPMGGGLPRILYPYSSLGSCICSSDSCEQLGP